jgi:hypothetical protein
VATTPHIHVPNAATGKWSCSLPETKSGGKYADQRDGTPDHGDAGRGPRHPGTVGHRRALIRSLCLHIRSSRST